MILNLGCGRKKFPGAIGVDIMEGEGVDIVADISSLPWQWEDDSIDGIHLSHVLEHFPDPEPIIRECYRVLKKGGFLRLVVPHCSSLSSIGCMGHYRTYSANTLHDYLDGQSVIAGYMFKGIKFKTRYFYLNWVWEEAAKQGYKDFPVYMRIFLPFLNYTITKMINTSHRIFERFWWPLVGGAAEVVWEGEKC